MRDTAASHPVSVAVVTLLTLMAVGCERAGVSTQVNEMTKQDVEVAPGRWLTLERSDSSIEMRVGEGAKLNLSVAGDGDQTTLVIPWQNEKVGWQGSPVPFCLRGHEERLYVIGLDRTNASKVVFRYYRQAGKSFEEILPRQFPKVIATQNIWIKPDAYSIGEGGRRIYDLQLARKIDPEDPYFMDTLTAKVWLHLLKGRDYADTVGEWDQDGCREFKKSFRPVELPTIVRTPAGWPATTQAAARNN